MINLKKYVNLIIFKIKERPFNVDSDFWDNLKIIDIEEDDYVRSGFDFYESID